MRTKVLYLAALTVLSACATHMSPADIQAADTAYLCNQYSGALSPNKGRPELRAEMLRRGETACWDPSVAEHRRNNGLATAMFGPIGGLVHGAVSPEPMPERTAEEVLRDENERLREELAKAR
jgi:hypothetical protein